MRDAPLSSTDISFFSTEIGNFYYIKKCKYNLHFKYITSNYLNLFYPFKVYFITMVTILMMSAKLATLGLPKIKIF